MQPFRSFFFVPSTSTILPSHDSEPGVTGVSRVETRGAGVAGVAGADVLDEGVDALEDEGADVEGEKSSLNTSREAPRTSRLCVCLTRLTKKKHHE